MKTLKTRMRRIGRRVGAALWIGLYLYMASWVAVWFLPGHDIGSQVMLVVVLLSWLMAWATNVLNWLTDELRKQRDEAANAAARDAAAAYRVWLFSVAPEQPEQGGR